LKLGRKKTMGSLYMFPWRLFWRRWQPKLSKWCQYFYFDLVREVPDTPRLSLGVDISSSTETMNFSEKKITN
jgi:hypothetical protein